MIGRDSDCDVILPTPRLSRRHCRILPVAQGFLSVALEDLGSSNGTLVNGVRVPARVQRLLRDGDVIEVGGVALAVAVSPVKKRLADAARPQRPPIKKPRG
jgi:pSer/pThr/pTyr-binding forkhead associated (FHA) protein